MNLPSSKDAAEPRPGPHEVRAWIVGGVSACVMLLELGAGRWLNSLALISDGLHTSTHVGVMALASGAYLYERRRRSDPRFAFGPGKATDLAAFASGVGLAVMALFIGLESLERLIHPEPVMLKDAAIVAGVSLVVGVISAALLHQGPAKGLDALDRDARDLNLWAAYLHMVADVLTSILALLALVVAVWLGWVQLDALVGILNAGVVAAFSARLIRKASRTLLDMAPPSASAELARRLRNDEPGLDARIWAIAPGRFAVAVRSTRGAPAGAASVRRLLSMPGVAHVFVEADGRSEAEPTPDLGRTDGGDPERRERSYAL